MIAMRPNCRMNERKLILKEKLYKPKIYLLYSAITFIFKESITKMPFIVFFAYAW
jgi:hypothetical protein